MDEIVKRLRGNPDFEALVAHILTVIGKLDTVEGLDKLDNDKAGEEAKVRLLASKKLREILSPFVNYREKIEPTPQQIQARKEQFGL